MNRPRIRAALLGAVLAVAATAPASLMAAPAQAAPTDTGDGRHCVIRLPAGYERCFDTYEASRAFVATYATAGEPKAGPIVARAGARAASSNVVVAILFDVEYWNPLLGSLIFDPRWNNDGSSYLAFSNCWINLHDGTSYGGAATGFRGSRATLGSMNNDASSISVS